MRVHVEVISAFINHSNIIDVCTRRGVVIERLVVHGTKMIPLGSISRVRDNKELTRRRVRRGERAYLFCTITNVIFGGSSFFKA